MNWQLVQAWHGGKALAAALLLAAIAGLAIFFPLDSPEGRLTSPGLLFLDAEGRTLQRETRDGFRIPIALDAVAPVAVAATVAAEDQRFFQHPGIDPLAIARALAYRDDAPSGASTITQQLARRLYLRDANLPAPVRKLVEMGQALRLEQQRSKGEILNLYLNDIYYGRGAHGIEAAARTYFGVPAHDLSTAQAALLVGLPRLPGSLDVGADLSAGRARQQYVLKRLVATGRLSVGDARQAAVEPLVFRQDPRGAEADHALLCVREELRRVAPHLADAPGLTVETTLDAVLQGEAERTVNTRLADLAGRNVNGAAVVVLNPNDGALLAMVGSPSFWEEQAGQVNMAIQPRYPGSALKPFLYAAAFEQGMTAATPVLDVATSFLTDQGPYRPLNYDRRFHGVLPARVALASSYNIPAVRVLDRVGKPHFLEMLHRVGLSTISQVDNYGLALALGGGEVRLLDLTAAYGAIATGGQLPRPYVIKRVRSTAGRVLSAPRVKGWRAK
ncbi:MAG: transglycosylase domain-containing protein, partial [Chloroflexota bacterium]